MNEAAKKARNAYKRAWSKANPDKVRAQQERYWTRKAQQAAETAAEMPENDRSNEDDN